MFLSVTDIESCALSYTSDFVLLVTKLDEDTDSCTAVNAIYLWMTRQSITNTMYS
jgi:hypothetical protein